MKKYIKPTVKEYQVMLHAMLAGSGGEIEKTDSPASKDYEVLGKEDNGIDW